MLKEDWLLLFRNSEENYLVLGLIFEFFMYIAIASSTLELQSCLLNLSL